MDIQMSEAVSYIRNVNKKKVTINKIVTYLNKGNGNKGHYQ